jgi:hypothetical protein
MLAKEDMRNEINIIMSKSEIDDLILPQHFGCSDLRRLHHKGGCYHVL